MQDNVGQDVMISASTAHEAAGRIGALPSQIRPRHPSFRICASAFPVRCPAGDNLWLHRAVYAAQAGQALVVEVTGGDGTDFGYWGEILSVAATERGLAGLVITGGVRDIDQLAQVGFPVFSTAVALRGTVKDPASAGQLGEPVRIGAVQVHDGDLVIADCDGVVVLPAADASAALAAAATREAKERDVLTRLRAGASTLEIYGLPET
jgi:4-hydroxy-4-methyl-2-oxoglutarate aldolase